MTEAEIPQRESVLVAVVLLTMDQSELTLSCLESLSAATGRESRVLLWDNGSTDGTEQAVRDRFPDVVTHHEPVNVGVASGRNGGSRLAQERWSPRYLLFLDNDMKVDPDFLTPLVSALEKEPRAAQAAGKIRELERPDRLFGAGGCRVVWWTGDTRHVGWGEIDRGQHDGTEPRLPSGGCMLVRTEVFEQLGGFDEVFDPYGPEDLDFGLRARKAGWKAVYVPGSLLFHPARPGRTFEKGQYSESFARHRAQHWLVFLRRHASWPQRLGFYLLGAPRLLSGLALREWGRGNLGPALRGLARGGWEAWRRSWTGKNEASRR